MYLSSLIDEVGRRSNDVRQLTAFLVERHEKPAAVHKEGRDRDIWNLAGPIALGPNPPELEPVGNDLENVREWFDRISDSKSGASSRSGERQLYLLVFDPNPGPAADDTGGGEQDGRDRDIWNLTGPLPPESLVAKLFESTAA